MDARDHTDDTSAVEQALTASIMAGGAPLVSKRLVASSTEFTSELMEFTAASGPVTLEFENSSDPGESCVSVAEVSVSSVGNRAAVLTKNPGPEQVDLLHLKSAHPIVGREESGIMGRNRALEFSLRAGAISESGGG